MNVLPKDPPYVPSPFTLTLLDNFGIRRRSKPRQSANHMSHHRSEARFRPVIDKEALLEQLRAQRTRQRNMKVSSGYLHRQLSNSKPSGAVVARNCMEGALKRQIEALAEKVQQQAAEITRIKTSKKYNRYVELLTAKDVYQEQLAAAANRTSRNKYALRQRKRMWKEHCRRQQDTQAMDSAVQNRLAQQIDALSHQVDEMEAKIKTGLQRQIGQAREKQRLIKEILQLQQLTGKLYIVEDQQTQQKEAPEPPQPLKETNPIVRHILQREKEQRKWQVSEEEEEDDSSCSQEESSEQEGQCRPSQPVVERRHGASF